MRDLIDQKAGVIGTSSRMAFRHASKGARLIDRAQTELGCNINDPDNSVQAVIDLAEANGRERAEDGTVVATGASPRLCARP